ncbi:DUF4268 domain-containing protein [Moraxella equi]|uniref:DUF4268 domain-containing protein n=1 Tax=Moraxella equi TaxID=60442 RepID=A0A378QVK5_9GAMM|nr:DUF4268 domain-containing protein [Moraxella equi]OPH38977.1 hypothetical protein B5J93_04815 [Moraxella equi]STZ04691.1 Uncharacterised protein [Moraxella equi]
MFTVDRQTNSISEISSKKFAELGFSELSHLQVWIEKNPHSLGEDLLFIQKEFDGFDGTKERLDLLALDKEGNLVIIENKRDDSGRDATWQALKYASYCSTLSKYQIKDIYQKYLVQNGMSEKDPEESISDFLDVDSFDDIQLNKNQRIILISGDYRKEVTSTVLWLMTKCNMRIQCFKATLYELNEQVFLDMEQIIPIKETEEFMIRMAEKNQEEQIIQNNLRDRHIEFWNLVISQCKDKNFHLFSEISPLPQNWISAGAGISGLSFNLVFNKNCARVELYISITSQAEKNKLIFDTLHEQKESIEKEIGALIWGRLDNKNACRIKKELSGVGLADKDTWQKAVDFLIDEMKVLSQVFKPCIEHIRKNVLQ